MTPIQTLGHLADSWVAIGDSDERPAYCSWSVGRISISLSAMCRGRVTM
jgi:hypothetical protein